MRGVTLFVLVLVTGCGGPAFTVTEATPTPADDAGGTATQPIELATVDATPVTPTTPDAGPEAGPDVATPEAEVHPMMLPEAAPEAEATPEASEVSTSPDAGPTILSPFRCVSPSMGYVACDSGGGWTLRWGNETCDYSHPPTAGCLQGSKCEFFQNGGTPIEGTCER